MRVNKTDKYCEDWDYKQLEDFDRIYGEELDERYGIESEYFFNEYFTKIHPYLSLITKWTTDKSVRAKETRMTLGVSSNVWNAAVTYMLPLRQALESERSLMKMKAEKDLQKAIDIKPDNAKLIDIEFTVYDSDYKKKEEHTHKMPDLKFEIIDAGREE